MYIGAYMHVCSRSHMHVAGFIAVQWNLELSKATTFGQKLLAALDRWSHYEGSTECKRVI